MGRKQQDKVGTLGETLGMNDLSPEEVLERIKASGSTALKPNITISRMLRRLASWRRDK